MFVFFFDNIKMFENLKYYLSGNIFLKFVKKLKYIKDFDKVYFLVFFDDIEFYFLYYVD